MEALFISLFLVGLTAFILGIIGLFKPFVNLRMKNRKWAGAWIFGGFVVMMIAAVNAPQTPPEMAVTTSGAVEVEASQSNAFTEAEDAFAALALCKEAPDADCTDQEAAAVAAQAAWEKQVDEVSTEIDRNADCIKRELGERFDNADISETLEARRKCGMNDPVDAEEQLREQRERLSR